MSVHPVLLDHPIHVDGVAVRLTVSYWGDLCGRGAVYHFTFASLAEPTRPIPVSHTGYLSHFLTVERELSYAELRDYAADFAADQVGQSAHEEDGQPSLFG